MSTGSQLSTLSDGELVPCRTVAWTAGVPLDQQRILATELDLSGDSRQRLAPSDVTSAIDGRPARRSAFGLVPCIH